MEGAGPIVDRVEAVVAAGIPVMGHVGPTPQQLQAGEVARVAGRTADAALRVLDESIRLQEAGCFSLVFEAIPADLKQQMVRAFTHFAEDARQHRFPANEHTYGGVADDELAALERGLPSVLAKYKYEGPRQPCFPTLQALSRRAHWAQ